jgi:hypothetical protein
MKPNGSSLFQPRMTLPITPARESASTTGYPDAVAAVQS